VVAAGREGFYGGDFGQGLLGLGKGEFVPDDLARPLADWVPPAGLGAWGQEVWTIPPNSQGYLTLAGAWIAERLDLGADPDAGQWAVATVAAAIAADHDRPEVLWEAADAATLLDPAQLSARLPWGTESVPNRRPMGWVGTSGDTTALAVVDADGMAVSLIQSNASGFGSHLFEPTTGINLHNRGIGFSLEPGHPAEYGPRRSPPHTLSPALVTTPEGDFVATLATQGGDGQPQILLQLLARLFAHGQSPRTAVASPRWVLTGSGQGFDTWTRGGGDPTVLIEDTCPPGWAAALTAAGHPVETVPAFGHVFGHAHVIQRRPDGFLAGAADPRARISSAAGY
jgi:gamma-glutamyltranspeptidase/glutathione hydrolase